jgi:hypothetical protein
MTSLVQRRCLNHAGREAVARCPECGRFFCRECISEHDDRILCAGCLGKTVATAARRSGALEGVFLLGQCLLAVAAIWFVFFLVGRSLLEIPTAFHEGRIWQFKQSE